MKLLIPNNQGDAADDAGPRAMQPLEIIALLLTSFVILGKFLNSVASQRFPHLWKKRDK